VDKYYLDDYTESILEKIKHTKNPQVDEQMKMLDIKYNDIARRISTDNTSH
jgi:hypothetical protein